jgi:hypothetical protein
LTNRVASAANIEYHARIVLQKHIQRELIRISSETIRDAYEDTTDVFQLLDHTSKTFLRLPREIYQEELQGDEGYHQPGNQGHRNCQAAFKWYHRCRIRIYRSRPCDGRLAKNQTSL